MSGIRHVTIFEKHPLGPLRAAPASGIALWRNALSCYDQLGLFPKLQNIGQLMNYSINYFDAQGRVLAAPPRWFSERIPILCLQREDLQAALVDHIVHTTKPNQTVEFKNGATILKITEHTQDHVSFVDSLGEEHQYDLLIGADGIHSDLRETLFPHISPKYCGYCYYRAVLDLPDQTYHQNAFESWGHGIRFGYVPLQYPKVFWFLSIPTKLDADHNPHITTHAVSAGDKLAMWDTLQKFKSPVDVKFLYDQTEARKILRTDIFKVPTCDQWFQNRIVLLGDAVHATSPNIAQGAGIAIEDALDLVGSIRVYNKQIQTDWHAVLKDYQSRRKSRARTVQFFADTIATVGQLNISCSWLRDWFMRFTSRWMPALQSRIFYSICEASLGGKNWLPAIATDTCLWENVIGIEQFAKLPSNVQHFRKQVYGEGKGVSSFSYSNSIYRLVGFLGRFPKQVENEPFVASVKVTDVFNSQVWTRKFGNSNPYSTEMKLVPVRSVNLNEFVLGETSGPVTFEYQISLQPGSDSQALRILYKSTRCSFFGFKLWRWLSPSSEWFEEPIPNSNGWIFNGTVRLPLLGKFFSYKGTFTFDLPNPQ